MKSETVNEAETSRTAEAQPRCAPAAGSALPVVNDFDGLYDYARKHGLHAVGAVLRKYVTEGEPLDWMPGYTSRAMCRCASMGVEGTDKDACPPTYMMTKYGSALYFHMWGGDELPQEPNAEGSRGRAQP